MDQSIVNPLFIHEVDQQYLYPFNSSWFLKSRCSRAEGLWRFVAVTFDLRHVHEETGQAKQHKRTKGNNENEEMWKNITVSKNDKNRMKGMGSFAITTL